VRSVRSARERDAIPAPGCVVQQRACVRGVRACNRQWDRPTDHRAQRDAADWATPTATVRGV